MPIGSTELPEVSREKGASLVRAHFRHDASERVEGDGRALAWADAETVSLGDPDVGEESAPGNLVLEDLEDGLAAIRASWAERRVVGATVRANKDVQSRQERSIAHLSSRRVCRNSRTDEASRIESR
jgi:hypothetical protein